jgi:hypothetical protein
LPTLVSKHDVVILDKLCHASLVDSAKLSGAIIRVFPHNHLGKLESHLDWARRERPDGRLVIVTESVFSMDGDRPSLREIIELKKRFDALLLLDEAHAIGVVGPKGRGLAAEIGLDGDVDVQMGTLSKALGVSAEVVTAPERVRPSQSEVMVLLSDPSLAASLLAPSASARPSSSGPGTGAICISSGNGLKAVESGLVDTVQVIYNIFDQSPEDNLFPLCQKKNVGVLARVPFDEGGLTGKVTPQTEFPKDDFRNNYFKGDRKQEVYGRVQKIVADLKIPP